MFIRRIRTSFKCAIVISLGVYIVGVLNLYKVIVNKYAMTQLYVPNIDYELYSKANYSMFEDLELYLRMSSAFLDKYDNILLPSLRFFWPGNVPLVIVLDAESADDKELGKTLSERYPYPRVEYQSPIDQNIYHGRGHERMQRDFFYPEEKVKKTYIGYVDTDTLFVTRVISELFFEEGKPVIIGNYGKEDIKWWSDATVPTEFLLKSREVMKGMAYFPVIMKVAHIVELRKYIEKIHNKPFDEIYRMVSDGAFSQFNVMCQYMWMFHRDEYKFYFHLRSYNNGTWHGEDNSIGRQPYEFYQTNVNEEQKMPKPRSSIHYRYHDNWENTSTLRNVIKTGLCFSGGFDICPEQCKHLNRSSLQKELYYFEFNDWSWDTRCLNQQRKHYSQVAKESNYVSLEALKEGCAQVDKLRFNP